MGIFNRSIPTYTVDTANKLRVTKPVVEEPVAQPYIDDIFDPVLNKNVRDSLIKRWGNPITATVAGYLDLLDNAFIGNNEQWGILGPGMGVLGTFGRSMDKAGDFIIGGVTEGVKGVTGQGMSNPLYQVFVEDKDYTGEKLLAAMGNSMAKMAGAPELTEEDFGGAWKIPSIGLELATDPGIMGGAMAKAGGAVGRLSTAEVLENIGKSGRTSLADVGQLLSNYDDAMAKIAIDVTAPGARTAIKKYMSHADQAFAHSSPEDYQNRILNAKTDADIRKVVSDMQKDPVLKKRVELEAAVEKGEKAFEERVATKEMLSDLPAVKDTTVKTPSSEVPPPTVDHTPAKSKRKVSKKKTVLKDFTPNAKHTRVKMSQEFEDYVHDVSKASYNYSSLRNLKEYDGKDVAAEIPKFSKPEPIDAEYYETVVTPHNHKRAVEEARTRFINAHGFDPDSAPEIPIPETLPVYANDAFESYIRNNPLTSNQEFLDWQDRVAKLYNTREGRESVQLAVSGKRNTKVIDEHGNVLKAGDITLGRLIHDARNGNLVKHWFGDFDDLYIENTLMRDADLDFPIDPRDSSVLYDDKLVQMPVWERDLQNARGYLIARRLTNSEDFLKKFAESSPYKDIVYPPEVLTPMRSAAKNRRTMETYVRTMSDLDEYNTLKNATWHDHKSLKVRDLTEKSVSDFLKGKFKTLTPEAQLEYLISHKRFFNSGTKASLVKKQTWFKKKVDDIVKRLDAKYPVKDLGTTDVARPYAFKGSVPTDAEFKHAEEVLKTSREYEPIRALKQRLDESWRMLQDIKEYSKGGWIPKEYYDAVRKEYDISVEEFRKLESSFKDVADEDLYNAYLTVESYKKGPTTKYGRSYKERELNAMVIAHEPDIASELRKLNADLTAPGKESKVVVKDGTVVPYKDTSTAVQGRPTDKAVYLAAHKGGPKDAVNFIRKVYNMDTDAAVAYVKDVLKRRKDIVNYRHGFKTSLSSYKDEYYSTISEKIKYVGESPEVVQKEMPLDKQREAVSNALRAMLNNPSAIISNDEYQLHNFIDFGDLEMLEIAIRDNNRAALPEGFTKKDLKALSTVDGFMDWIENTVDNVGAVHSVKKIVDPYLKQFHDDAAITISPSTLYNIRNTDVLHNAMNELDSRLKQLLKDYGYLDDATKQGDVWDIIDNDPVIQNIFTPAWRTDQYLGDLELMFKQLGLRPPLNNSRLRTNFYQEISKYPALKKALGVKDAFVEDMSDVFFGDKIVRKSYNSELKKFEEAAPYTVQRQFLAYDSFTKNIIKSIDELALKEQGWAMDVIEATALQRGVKILQYPHEWFTPSLYESLSKHIVLPPYADALHQIKEMTKYYLNGDLYTELYRFAKDVQANIFEPVKMRERIGVSGLNAKEQDILEDFSITREFGNVLRTHPDRFKTIGDISEFATKVGDNGHALNEFVEVKAKNIGRLTMQGSKLPDVLKTYSKNFADAKYVDSYMYPIRAYLNGAGNDAVELARRKKVLKALAKADTDDSAKTVSEILKDVGGVDDDIRKLFTKYDLTPDYVKDIEYDYVNTVGNSIIAENEALARLNAKKPSEIIQEPTVTATDVAKEKVYEATGLSELAEDVSKMTDGKGPGDLTPDNVETLRTTYGDEAVDLFDLIHKAFVSDQNAKFAKTNTVSTRTGKALAAESADLAKDAHAAENLMKYDAIQTKERGDIVSYKSLVDEIFTSKRPVGILLSGSDDIAAVESQLMDFASDVNRQMGTSVFKVHKNTGKHGTFVCVYPDVSNAKRIYKAKFSNLKFDDSRQVIFEKPSALDASLATFKASDAYAKNDHFVKGMSDYTRNIDTKLGFSYEAVPHVKHVLNDVDAKHAPVIAEFYEGINLDAVQELCNRMLNSDSFKHLYGTFGAVPFGRAFRGGNWRYNTGKFNTFNFNPERVLTSTLSEGVLSNTNVQGFVGLFVNDNFKLKTYFESADEIMDILHAKTPSGKISGNLNNLEVIAPVYDETGKIVKFRKFNKMSIDSISDALKTEDAILVPSGIVAPLDAWCKHNAKMSNKVYRFINRMFTLPYKFGVLANPGFLLGNVSDAYLKQATTLSQKYGTSVAEEVANVAACLREVTVLNNRASDIYEAILGDFSAKGVKILPSEKPIEALTLNSKARKRMVDYFNGALKDMSGNPIVPSISTNDIDTMRIWMYLNSVQPTKAVGEGIRDVSKTDLDIDVGSNVIERVFYGSKKYNAKDPSTWGLFTNNPYTKAIFGASESVEAYFRSANILNALKHDGYSVSELSKMLGEGYDEALAKKLHVDTVNAMNVMYNSNFNYDMQSGLIDKLGYAVPFPTFFIKNLGYWLELFVDNPQYVDHAITIHEGLWSDRDEEVGEDKFMAEAKGRGAVPISDGDEHGLSKVFKGIYKPTPLNSMFSAFNLLNNPIENLTTRVHPMLGGPMQIAQAKLAPEGSLLATEPEDVKYRPYSTNRFEKNINVDNPNFNSLQYMFHKLNPFDRAIGNTIRLPGKIGAGDVQLSDAMPSVFQPDF